MTIKKTIFLSLSAAMASSLACIIYNTIYSKAFEVKFQSILNSGSIIGACVIACLLMGIAYFLAYKWKGQKLIGWLNISIGILSFASIINVLGMQLPMEIESPEMFPGLAVPMHFFPAMSFFALVPFFNK